MKLNGGYIIAGIFNWAIPLLRYSAAFLDYTEAELKQMDRRTRKLHIFYKQLNCFGQVFGCLSWRTISGLKLLKKLPTNQKVTKKKL